MPRTLDPEAHATRREVFVDAAQALIAGKGYEQMSVSDVLDAADASRGAFYHYYESKADLLEAVVDRMVDGALASVAPIVDDGTLTAPEKFRGVFTGIARFKNARSELLLGLLRTWLSDDNAIVREKFRRVLVERLTPVLTRIVAQGKAEGVFAIDDPGLTAAVLVSLLQGTNEAALHLYLDRQAGRISFETVERTFATYGDAYDRILGAQPGTVAFADAATLHQWFD